MPSDSHLIQFVHDLGLSSALRWRRTYTGFFVDKRLYSISSNLEFLKFPLLSLASKARLAWTMLYASRIKHWQRLENISVEDWLVRTSGQETYDKLWKPLLLAKLGDSYQRVSAVFIWSYIKRLFSARHSAASKEQLGHVAGGYRSVFECLTAEVVRGGEVRTGAPITSIRVAEDQGITISRDAVDETFDRVVCTSPVPVLQALAEPGLITVSGPDADVEYLGVICVVLVSDAALVPYYVVNIADKEIPFTGVIGMSNVVSPKFTAGKHLTYLPKYVLASDTVWQQSDEKICSWFLDGVRRMIPDFDAGTINSIHVNRAARVQPLQVMNYSQLVPSVTTTHPNFFVLNTSQFVNATLNNNEVIRTVNEFYKMHGQHLISDRTRIATEG